MISEEVIILTRTLMSNGVCVGAYDLERNMMLRLLDNKAQRLSNEAPFQIGEIYRMDYNHRYANQITLPHTEDVAVYSFEKTSDPDFQELHDICDQLAIHDINLENLFDNSLHIENRAFLLKDNVPQYSVQFATLNHDLHKIDRGYRTERDDNLNCTVIAYVGENNIDNMPDIIEAGTIIRFSLARFWDKGDGVLRSYLQISGIF